MQHVLLTLTAQQEDGMSNTILDHWLVHYAVGVVVGVFIGFLLWG